MNLLHKKQDLRQEFNRRMSTRARMLRAFQQNVELDTKDLLAFGPGLSSRLHELRKDGHKIISQYEKPGHYRYTYLGKDEADSNVSVID
jgi:hypothetical protein